MPDTLHTPRLQPVCQLPEGWSLHADAAGVPWLESPEGLFGVAGRGPMPLAWREPLRRIAAPFTSKHRPPLRRSERRAEGGAGGAGKMERRVATLGCRPGHFRST